MNFLEVEIDLEDLLTNPFNTQPPSLNEIQKMTNFRKDWIMFLYRNFKQVNLAALIKLYKFYLNKKTLVQIIDKQLLCPAKKCRQGCRSMF